jgi:two-component system, response regulator PdtaR
MSFCADDRQWCEETALAKQTVPLQTTAADKSKACRPLFFQGLEPAYHSRVSDLVSESAPPMLPQFEPLSGKPRVLVVEDEPLIRAILSDELRTAGVTVIEAATADEALAYLKAVGMVDLVFTDIQMPGSMNGLELARRLREQNPALPIIVTSGNAGPQGVEERVGRFLPKPYDMDRAVTAICAALGFSP